MKFTNSTQFKTTKAAIVKDKPKQSNHKNIHYLQLSNQQFLKRNLMLLGVTQAIFLKQTKYSLQVQLFPKTQTNPTATKQFFFISFFCLQKLTSEEEIKDVKIWYPPRSVSQQLEYKKAFFKAVQNLQLLGRVPKNMIISKGLIMGDNSSSSLLQFLRFFSQMALRYQYIQKYSKNQKLIQICCNHSGSNSQNNINRFYVYPFVPSNTTASFEHANINLPLLKQLYYDYLKIYFRKLAKLRTKTINPILADMHQQLMKKYMQQKQLSETLSAKIPSALLGQNRSFDRRRIIDKNKQIWDELQKLQLNFVEQKQPQVLKVQGQVDKLLQKWQPAKGISNIVQANISLKEVPKLKNAVNDKMTKFRELCKQIQLKIKP